MVKKKVNIGNPALDIIQGRQEASQAVEIRKDTTLYDMDNRPMVQVNTRAPKALKEALTRIAYVERESLNGLIVRVLSEYVEENAAALEEYKRLKKA